MVMDRGPGVIALEGMIRTSWATSSVLVLLGLACLHSRYFLAVG